MLVASLVLFEAITTHRSSAHRAFEALVLIEVVTATFEVLVFVGPEIEVVTCRNVELLQLDPMASASGCAEFARTICRQLMSVPCHLDDGSTNG